MTLRKATLTVKIVGMAFLIDHKIGNHEIQKDVMLLIISWY